MEVKTAAIDVPRPPARVNIPNPKPIETGDVRWKVITPDRLPEGDDWVLYALTNKDYETLVRNTADIYRWVEEAQWRLLYYQGKAGLDGVSAEQAESE